MDSIIPLESSRHIDMWALPGAHPTNIELMQKLKTADSNHFNKSMEVVGTVSEQDPESQKYQKTHLVGVRTDIWKPNEQEMASSLRSLKKRRKQELKKQIKRSGRLSGSQTARLQNTVADDSVMQLDSGDIEKRRLVLKLFGTTTTRTRWCGSIEEITTSEVHNSIGSNRCLISLVVILPRVKIVTHIQQNHRTFRWPAVFSFCYYDGQRMWHVTLKQRWVSFGPDFDVFVDGQEIGLLDSKVACFGSDSYVSLDSHPLAKDRGFIDSMTLFAASTGYHRAIRKNIKKRIRLVENGESHCHIIEDEELKMRYNGRAAA